MCPHARSRRCLYVRAWSTCATVQPFPRARVYMSKRAAHMHPLARSPVTVPGRCRHTAVPAPRTRAPEPRAHALQSPVRSRAPRNRAPEPPGAARLPALGPAGRQVRARARGQLLRVRPQLAGRQQAAQAAQQRRMAREERARRQLEHAPGEPLHRRPGGAQDAHLCPGTHIGASLEHTGPPQLLKGLPASSAAFSRSSARSGAAHVSRRMDEVPRG